jgi:hypothetical protein
LCCVRVEGQKVGGVDGSLAWTARLPCTLYQEKKKTAGLQDGNREWVTVLACIRADGSKIDPVVIFAGKRDLCSAWVHNVEPGKHRIFFGTLPTGWTNNDLGLAWVEQVFD